ncbi:hypothetical protein ACH0BU_00175 [Sphingomonas olei]
MSKNLVPAPNTGLLHAENVPGMLASIRPQWQARNLIDRVRRLVDVDPSSACQRILNAAIHDLREKIVIAGVDIAGEAARQHKLPPVTKADDIENYSNSNVLDLSYRMGLLSRPEWRRISRCYEIRRDLEHEDDEYEAGIEDVVYIFRTCIEVVLARDPINLVRVTEFKSLVEQPNAAVPDDALLEDFEKAPQPRQEEIGGFLISMALDKDQPDLVQQNAYNALSSIATLLTSAAKVALGSSLQNKIGRQMNDRQARVAAASGLMPYVRQAARTSFFEDVHANMQKVGTNWSAYPHHGDLLRNFEEYGGIDSCPPETQRKILKWLVLTYIGTSGGRTSYGNIRNVYYSNSAAPYVRSILQESKSNLRPILESLKDSKSISRLLDDKHIARRFETLMDDVSAQ